MNGPVAVIDTNVVVAGLITSQPDSSTVRILDAMLSGELVYLLSVELLREYRSVLMRPQIVRRHGLKASEIDQILTEIAANAIWREALPDMEHLPPDPQDAHLWALLATEPNAILITGDKLLVEYPPPRRSVLLPSTWIDHFQK